MYYSSSGNNRCICVISNQCCFIIKLLTIYIFTICIYLEFVFSFAFKADAIEKIDNKTSDVLHSLINLCNNIQSAVKVLCNLTDEFIMCMELLH